MTEEAGPPARDDEVDVAAAVSEPSTPSMREAGLVSGPSLHNAEDASSELIALVIGQQCIEGVRASPPSSQTLLRVLTAVGRFGKARGQALHLVTSFALIDLAQREQDPRAWFYVDNHMRPVHG